jgi:hypothetical protein
MTADFDEFRELAPIAAQSAGFLHPRREGAAGADRRVGAD